jgi:hypothetical protein
MSSIQSSFDVLVEQVQALTNEEALSLWLMEALDPRSQGKAYLPTRGERHNLVSKLYKRCDPLLQATFAKALANILQSYEPGLKPDSLEPQYLYSLLSVAAVIRNEQIKERLRRWFFEEWFSEWHYGIYNLYATLLLTTSAYDSDEQWATFIRKTLPTKPYFHEIAIESYAALLNTRGEESIELLPEVLAVIDSADENALGRLGVLVSETIERFSEERFFHLAAKALNRQKQDVAQICSNVLKFEELIERELKGELRSRNWPGFLGTRVWEPAIKRWSSAGSNAAVFSDIIAKCDDMSFVPSGYVRGDNRVLIFGRQGHEIVISPPIGRFSAFFQPYDNYHETSIESGLVVDKHINKSEKQQFEYR